MSVLIKGMEIPDKCGHCRFATAFECQVTKNFITTFNVRQVDCPLVPVPPHGRLGDLDALMDRIEHDTPLSSTFEKIVRRYIENAPTVIPTEEGE